MDVYTPGAIPTIFEYQGIVATQWNEVEFATMCENVLEDKIDDTAMLYLDILVKRDIEAGKRGCEWIAINQCGAPAGKVLSLYYKKKWSIEESTTPQGSEAQGETVKDDGDEADGYNSGNH